jgi:ABC-type glycerol-3-phosphate transport system permease component
VLAKLLYEAGYADVLNAGTPVFPGVVDYLESMATMGSLMIVPIILFSLFSQKYLVRGLTFGAVKG